ncbi:hypothetical protein V8B97DRAFT_1915580 [Scleroderma yunnanense]
MDTQSAASYVRQLQAPLVGSFISLMILESVHSGFIISFNNSYFINGFSDPAIFEHIIWDFMVNIEIGSYSPIAMWCLLICYIPVKLLYLASVDVIQKGLGHCPTFVSGNCSICNRLSFNIDRRHSFFDNTWTSFMEHALAIAAASMGATVLADTLIASTLAYYLYSRRAQSSTRMVTRLLAYVVGTGALTSIFSVIELICVKIYANSALLSLNLRQYQRQEDVVPSLGNVNTTSGDSKLFITPV